MKINSLRTQNWRNHTDSVLELAGVKLGILVGLSRAGKSSIVYALEQLLTGTCELTGKQGERSELLIQHGKALAILEAETSCGRITRQVPNSLQVGDRKGGVTEQQKTLYETLGVTREDVRQAIDCRSFLSLTPDKQKDILFSRLGLSFTTKTITEALNTWDKQFPTLGEWFKTHLPEASKTQEKNPLHAYAYAERRAEKKRLADAKTRLAGINVPDLPDKPEDELLKSRGVLELERDGILADSGAYEQKRKRLSDVNADIEAFEGEVRRLKSEAEKVKPATHVKNFETEKKRLEAEIKSLEETVSSGDKLVAGHKGERDTLNKTADRIRAAGGKCPLADSIQCPMKPLDMAEVVQGLVDQAGQLDAEISETEGKVKKARENLEDMKTQLRGCESNIREMQDRNTRHEGLQKQFTEKDASLKKLQTEKAGINLGSQVDQKASLEALKQKIEAINATLKIHADYRRTYNDRAVVRQEVADLGSEVDRWESLVRAFEPSGIKQTLLEEKLGPFTAAVNTKVPMLIPGAAVEIRMEPDFGFWVSMPGRGTIPVANLSDSERALVGSVLAWAILRNLGLRLLVVDRLEHLDPNLRTAYYRFLLSLGADFDLILVLMVLADKDDHGRPRIPDPPAIPGVGLFLVEDGTITRVGAQQAAQGVAA